MRRLIRGLLPVAMAGAALFAAAPAATAAPTHPAAVGCPTYGPGGCTGHVTITVTQNPNGTVTLHIVVTGFKPGEVVDITVTLPDRSVGSFTATGPGQSIAATNASPYDGSASGTIVLPAGYPAGQHELIATGTVSGVVATTTFTLGSSSGAIRPCTTSASSAHASGVVLVAAYLAAQCKTAIPAGSPGLPQAGGSGGLAQQPVAAAAPQSPASQLPFTGFNASTFAAGGAIMVGGGGTMVLASRRRRRNAWR